MPRTITVMAVILRARPDASLVVVLRSSAARRPGRGLVASKEGSPGAAFDFQLAWRDKCRTLRSTRLPYLLSGGATTHREHDERSAEALHPRLRDHQKDGQHH